MKDNANFQFLNRQILSAGWGTLSKITFRLLRRDGTWQTLDREVYDRGNAAACLLFDRVAGTVLLTRQFRLPARIVGEDGPLIEVPAGMLDGADPAERMRAELVEETGYAASDLAFLFKIHMSPGSVAEVIHCYLGSYTRSEHVSAGGGNREEGEDIEVLHLSLDEAMAMIETGDIRDAKTVILLQHLALSERGKP